MTDAAYLRLIDALQANGRNVIDHGDKATAQCPAHDDTHASLSVGPRRDHKGVLVFCHAGCQTDDIVAALGWSMTDLFDDAGMRDAYSDRTTYDYPGGRKVHRQPGKKFWQDGDKSDRSLFHADRIGDADTVFVPEGEKDVLAAESVGAVAVCSAMGAGKAHKADWSPLRGKHVIVVADTDEPGRKHAADEAKLLGPIAASVKVGEPAIGGDLADHIAAGKTLDELVITFDPSAGMPRRWRADDLKPAAQSRWLAKNRLPHGAVSLLIGDEGIGKSLLWVLIAAAVTTGKPVPEFGIPARDPGRVLIAAITEDDWRTVVRPRLEVAGADFTMIEVICVDDDGTGAPTFPRDLFLITEATPKPDLVVVDAWLDTVPASLQVRDTQQARQALHPWKDAATLTDAAMMLLCHTNRVGTANARDRYGATIALRQKARMTLFAQTDEDGNLVVGPEKANSAAATNATLFTIGKVAYFAPTEDDDGTVPLLRCIGESAQTAREHLADAYTADHDTGSDDVVGWLAVFLAAGPRWATEIYTAAEEAGYSRDKMKRAKIKLNVKADRQIYNGPWFWALPQHSGSKSGSALSPISRTPLPDSPDENTGSASTSQDKLRANGERWDNAPLPDSDPSRPKFEPPTGPDRCRQCGWHTPTQGHKPGCPANEGDPEPP